MLTLPSHHSDMRSGGMLLLFFMMLSCCCLFDGFGIGKGGYDCCFFNDMLRHKRLSCGSVDFADDERDDENIVVEEEMTFGNKGRMDGKEREESRNCVSCYKEVFLKGMTPRKAWKSKKIHHNMPGITFTMEDIVCSTCYRDMKPVTPGSLSSSNRSSMSSSDDTQNQYAIVRRRRRR